MSAALDPAVVAFLTATRVAHFATVHADGTPLVLPVCFAVEDPHVFISLDEKPKRRDPLDLERVRNLQAHPRVAIVADRWDEDWTRLAWVHLSGTARILLSDTGDADLHRQAITLLRAKYSQYATMALESRPVIAVQIDAVKTWGAVELPPA
jgi:PPOX class probable F420-dependent enzyme